MHGKTFFEGYFMIVLLVFHLQIMAQCPSPEVFMKVISAVEDVNNTQTIEEKIEILHSQERLFIKECSVPDSIYGRILHRLGQLYEKTGNLQKAIYYTRGAVGINSSNSIKASKAFLVNSYYNLGLFHSQLYLFSESNKYFDSCIYIGQQYPEKAYILLMAYEKKAFTFFQSADFQKSIQTAEQGIALSERNRDSLSLSSLLLQKAQSQIALNDTVEAGQNVKKAIRILEINHVANGNLANGFHIYADLLRSENEIKKSIEYYNKAFRLNSKLNYDVQAARNMINLGLLYAESKKDGGKAIACYKQGIKIIQKNNDPYVLTGLYINIGVVYWQNKHYKQALDYYQKALNALLVHFTDSSIKSNPSHDVLREIPNNYDYYVSTLLVNKGDAFLDWYKANKKKDLLYDALNAYQAADFAVDLMRWKQYGEHSKLFWRKKTKLMYENAIETCYNLNDPSKAFYFFEKSRAVLLNDKLNETGAKKYISRKDSIKERQLYIRTVSTRNLLSSLSVTQENYDHTRQEMLAAQDELDKFIKGLENKYPVYYKYKYDNKVYSLNQVKAKLVAANQSMLELFSGDSTVYILYISPQRNVFRKLPFKIYDTTARELIKLCSDKFLLNHNYQRYSYLARKLFDTLIKPLNIPQGKVVISCDDHFIPFELLLSDTTGNSFLLKKYAFSYTYSARFLFKTESEQGKAPSVFLGVAPINYADDELLPLEGAKESLHRLESYFKSARLLTGEDATKKRFMANLPGYRIIQLYSHADAYSTGEEPKLYLADSAIYLSEIQTFDDLKADMIVLSACKTSIGKNETGEGMFSLARGFFSIGIPCTISTFWQIEDETTFTLTESFYKFLHEGMTKDEALQKAKLELIENNDIAFELPYYWAAYILIGNTDALAKEKKDIDYSGYLPAVIIVFAIISLIIIFYKTKSR